MYDEIVNILSILDIEVGFMQYKGNSNEYIIFSIYDDKDSCFLDDENESVKYYITLNYWFKSLKNINKYKEIKDLMKSKGFIYDGGKDLIDGNLYGKNLDFIYEEFK